MGSSSTDKQISSSSGCGSISVQTLSYVPMVALCHHDCCELLDVSDSRFSNRFLKEEGGKRKKLAGARVINEIKVKT